MGPQSAPPPARRLMRWLAATGLGIGLLLPIAHLPGARAAGPSPESVVVVTDDHYPPYVFRDQGGQVQGILKEQWALWSQRTGIRVDLRAIDWAEAQRALLAGEADVIDTLFRTEARETRYSFGRPYASIDVPIFFHESISGSVNADTLKGFTVGVKAGDACVDLLRGRGVESLKPYPDYEAVVAAARDGEILVFCVDLPPARYLLHKLGVADQFRHSKPLSTGEFHRAVKKGNEALLAIVEDGFARLSPAELEAIDSHWFGAPLAAPAWGRWVRPLGYATVVAVAALLLLLGWNLTLRKRVRARTLELSHSVVALDAARRAAEASRDHLDAMLQAIPDLLFEVDADGRYLDFRAQQPELLLVPANALIGSLISDHFHGPALEVAELAIAEAVRDGRSSGRQFKLDLPSGEHWFELSMARKRQAAGEKARIIVLSRDITSRKQAELALQESERNFRLFFEAGLVGMAIHGVDQRWTGFNDRLCQMLGYGADELRRLSWVELTHPDDRAASQAVFERLVAGELDSATLDRRLLRKDGSQLEARVVIHCVRDAERKPLKFFVVVEDVSARKAAEREIENHRDRLEELVQERSRELVAARDEAQEASRAKSELLSRMSHELRTPMNAILGFSQLLELDQALAPSSRRFVSEILRAGKHLLDLINDVLDLAQVESGRLSLTLEPLVLHEVLSDVMTLMQPLADRRGVSLRMEAQATLRARADRTRLKQVLVNLVSNAIKYNRNDGSVQVSVRAASDTAVRISVRDTGPGIAIEQQPKLFEPFNRLGAEFGSVEGTGIGLSICRRLVELMHGRIGVDSEVDRGSEFWVELPSAPADGAEPGPAQHRPPQAPPLPTQATLLYVEDNLANQRLMQHLVGRLGGLRLLVARDAETGLELARQHRPALILLDINLPGMDGYAALDALRLDPLTRATPVLALTANAMPSDVRRAMAAGFAAHVAKPIDLVSFEALLRRLLAMGDGDRGVS